MGGANKSQYNKASPNSYNPNESIYKGVNDNYQTGTPNHIFNTPNYTMNKTSQGLVGGQQRGYIDH